MDNHSKIIIVKAEILHFVQNESAKTNVILETLWYPPYRKIGKFFVRTETLRVAQSDREAVILDERYLFLSTLSRFCEGSQ